MSAVHQLQSIATISEEPRSKLSFTFTFPIFFSLPKVTGKACISSPSIADSKGRLWWMDVYPDGDGIVNASWVSCYVGCDHDVADVTCLVTFAHNKDAKKPPHKVEWITDAFANVSDGLPQFISRDSLQSNHCLSDGSVVFLVEITIKHQKECAVRSVKRPICEIAAEHSRIFVHCLRLEYSDMTLIVGEERLPAHKNIVCPRSAVFRAMFQHAMQEATTNEVQVSEECSTEAIKAMLHYLYADMIPADALQKHAAQLLALASFYQINDLQTYVEDYVHIGLDNVRALLQVIEQHGSKKFLHRVLQFVAGHGKQLFKQHEFFDSLDSKTNQLVMLAATEEEDEEDETADEAADDAAAAKEADATETT